MDDIGIGAAMLGRSRPGRGAVERAPWFARMRPFAGLAGTSMHVAILIVLACVLLLVAPVPIGRIGERAAAEPLKAGLIGLLIELAFIPTLIVTVVLLVVTIVGIPLLALVPLALLALVIVLLAGFTAVSHRLGARTAARFGWSLPGPYVATAIGVLIVVGPLLLSRILGTAIGGVGFVTVPLAVVGVLAEYVAWTVGLGAAALARFRPAAA